MKMRLEDDWETKYNRLYKNYEILEKESLRLESENRELLNKNRTNSQSKEVIDYESIAGLDLTWQIIDEAVKVTRDFSITGRLAVKMQKARGKALQDGINAKEKTLSVV